MKSTMRVEDRILSAAVCACYVFALTACGLVTYAVVALSRAAHGGLGRGFFLTASQF